MAGLCGRTGAKWKAYTRLRQIRNAIAHATPEAERSDWIGPALSDPAALRRELTTCFRVLFRDELRGDAPADAQPEEGEGAG